MTEPLRVGIIGYGQQGEAHAKVWARMPGARLSAVAEPDPERAALAVRHHAANGCTLYERGQEMIVKARLDIVVVATLPSSHAALSIAALERGAHVICEKPMALSLEEADEMVAAARSADRQLAIHCQSRFSRAAIRAGEMLTADAIGPLRRMDSWCKGRPAPYDLMEVGAHMLDLMLAFARTWDVSWPFAVFGDGTWRGLLLRRDDARETTALYPGGRDMGIGAGDYLFGYYFFSGGVRGTLTLITVPPKLQSSEYMAIELRGDKGRLRLHQTKTGRLFFKPMPWDDLSDESMSSTFRGWEEVDRSLWENDPLWTGPMRRFAEDFLAAILEKRPPLVSGEDGRMALEMALGIYASHLAGRPLKLPLEERTHPLR